MGVFIGRVANFQGFVSDRVGNSSGSLAELELFNSDVIAGLEMRLQVLLEA